MKPFFCCYCVLACLAISRLQGGTIDLPLNQYSNGGTVLDKASSNGVCLAADTQSDGSLPEIKIPDLSPGFYDLHLNLKMSHTISPYVAHIEFKIAVNHNRKDVAARTYQIIDFELPNQYREFVIPFQLEYPGKTTINVSWAWQKQKDKKRPFAQSTAPKLEKNIDNVGGNDDDVEEKFNLSDYPFFIAMDKAWLDYHGPVGISKLKVDKVRYKPKETAKVAVVLRNYGSEPERVTLKTELIREMANAKEVATQTVEVEPGKTESVNIEAPLSDQLWGHEIRCTLLDSKDQVVSQRSEYFTVHHNPWAVAIGVYGVNLPYYRAGPNNKNCDRMAEHAVRNYGNCIEFVFWAPDDFGNLNPVKNPYWSGQMRHQSGDKATKGLIEAYHRRGVACSFYALFTAADGKSGYELYRKHPDWFKPAFYDVDHFDRWDRAKELISWPRVGVSQKLETPYMHHANEIIKSVKNFGWDSIRYDTDMSVPSMSDGKPYCADIFPKVKVKVMAACPGFQWGYNDALHRKNLKDKPLLQKLFKAKCENGGLIMDEYTNHGVKEKWSYNRFASRMVGFRDMVHPLGGHVTYTKADCGIVDYVYHWILPLAARGHHAWDPMKGRRIYANYNQFCTRFAGYIWDNKAIRLKNAKDLIDWGEAGKQLFKWTDYVYLRNTGNDKQQLIMQLVNMPPERINCYDDNRVPPPRLNFGCSIRLPDGVAAKEVWFTTAEPRLTQKKLDFKREEGNTIKFTVPKLRFWDMLVTETEGKGVWQ